MAPKFRRTIQSAMVNRTLPSFRKSNGPLRRPIEIGEQAE